MPPAEGARTEPVQMPGEVCESAKLSGPLPVSDSETRYISTREASPVVRTRSEMGADAWTVLGCIEAPMTAGGWLAGPGVAVGRGRRVRVGSGDGVAVGSGVAVAIAAC